MLVEKTLKEFLDELASNSSAPGGGSVAALCGALAAALCSMVCRLTIGKKKYADVSEELQNVLDKMEQFRIELTALIDEDTRAFNKVMDAFKLPKETEEQISLRKAEIQKATKTAAEVPMLVLKKASEVIELAKLVASKGNINSISDASVGCLLLQTCGAAALYNILINLKSIEDDEYKSKLQSEIETCSKTIENQSNEIRQIIHEKFVN
jgi:formiminotetrahydrofolate cyclodeaminase